jgi:hypothetical protein
MCMEERKQKQKQKSAPPLFPRAYVAKSRRGEKEGKEDDVEGEGENENMFAS